MTLPDRLTAFLVAICCTIPVVLLALLAMRAHSAGRRMRAIVLGLTLIHQTALIAFPGWYSAFSGFSLEAAIGVAPNQLLTVYLGDMIFAMLFALVFVLPEKGFALRQRSFCQKPEKRDLQERVLIYVLVGGAAFYYVGRMFSPTYTTNDVAHSYQIIVKTDLWESIFDWCGTLVQWPGLIGAGWMAADKGMPRLARCLGVSVLAGELIFAMIHGFRGGTVWVVSAIIIAAYYESRKRLMLVAAALTVFLVSLFPWLHSTMRYASIAAPAGTQRWQMIPFLLRGITDASTISHGASESSFLESWAIRAEGPRNSTALYALYNRGEQAAYRPILGGLLLPVPRFWWPDKPATGSTDSTNLGAAIYRVQQGKPNSAFYDMGPLLASAHAYWEGGWAWLILAPLITAWMWRQLLAWAETERRRSVDLIVCAFVTALPIDGFFSGINPVYAFVKLAWITLIPLGAAILIFKKSRRSRRYHAAPIVSRRIAVRAI